MTTTITFDQIITAAKSRGLNFSVRNTNSPWEIGIEFTDCVFTWFRVYDDGMCFFDHKYSQRTGSTRCDRRAKWSAWDQLTKLVETKS